LKDDDSDRQQKIAEIRKNAGHALETVNSFTLANATPEQITAYKKTLQSMAHSALGITALKANDNQTAEQELNSAAELNVTQPDPYIWYNLALAQDHQEKYPEALVSINRALKYAENSDLADTIQGERKRLLIKNGSTGEETPNQPPAAPSPAAKQSAPK
jgi:tetratricopeptide (TPR) repeat protein